MIYVLLLFESIVGCRDVRPYEFFETVTLTVISWLLFGVKKKKKQKSKRLRKTA